MAGAQMTLMLGKATEIVAAARRVSSLCFIIFLEKKPALVKSSPLRGWARKGWRDPLSNGELVGGGARTPEPVSSALEPRGKTECHRQNEAC
jgi:hypothetical protein